MGSIPHARHWCGNSGGAAINWASEEQPWEQGFQEKKVAFETYPAWQGVEEERNYAPRHLGEKGWLYKRLMQVLNYMNDWFPEQIDSMLKAKEGTVSSVMLVPCICG